MKACHRYELDGEILEISRALGRAHPAYVEDYGDYYRPAGLHPGGPAHPADH